MVSQQQLEANRQNAQHSTGPNTDPGKEASSLNATKHGLDTNILMPWEDPDQYDMFYVTMIEELQPVGMLEYHYAEQFINNAWRSRRGAVYEAKLGRELDSGKEQSEEVARLSQSETRVFNRVEKLYKKLKTLQQERIRDERRQRREMEDEAIREINQAMFAAMMEVQQQKTPAPSKPAQTPFQALSQPKNGNHTSVEQFFDALAAKSPHPSQNGFVLPKNKKPAPAETRPNDSEPFALFKTHV